MELTLSLESGLPVPGEMLLVLVRADGELPLEVGGVGELPLELMVSFRWRLEVLVSSRWS